MPSPPETSTLSAIREPPSLDSLMGQAPVMMRGGVMVSHAVLLVVAALALVVAGRDAALSVVLAGFTVSAFLLIGQTLQMGLVRRADLHAMALTLLGFGLRATALCGALLLWIQVGERYPIIRPWGVLAGAVSLSLGWIAGVLLTYRRLRVPVFDQPRASAGRGEERQHDAGSPATPSIPRSDPESQS